MKRISSFVELTKPRITLFILMSAAIGFLCASHVNSSWTWMQFFHTLLGTALIASGTAALNQWYEREADAKMNRTRNRPIPSGRLNEGEAMWFGIGLSVVGFVELWLGANLLTGLLGAFTLASYLFAYTPLKQKSWHSTTIGAIPGAMPPLIGYAAAANTLGWDAAALYLILFLWQFPHFYAIASMYKEDYGRAGIRMLPVVEPDGESTARQILWFSFALVPISLLPRYLLMAGNVYLIGALALGAMVIWSAFRVSHDHSRIRARQVLLASVVYLPVLYGLLVFDGPRV